MNYTWLNKNWQIGFSVGSISLFSLSSIPCFAQLVPDNTLGNESSVVNPRDVTSDRIDGGAIRGQNLFHSFQEFNVDAGRGIYFSNPDAVNNIFSRVTGNNVSNILGTLGVDGAANLFLINPNGIIFGKNASLDITGSFFATSADGIELGENGFFSATQPQQSSLLSVNPGAFFYNQVASQPGNIINQAVLVTGEDLTLDANNLDIQGQILAGRDLILSALDTVKIRDSVTNPFIANAQGNLLIQGSQSVDILALNHPDSGLFSGAEMIMRSAKSVGGDAHFNSGGSFRVEQLDKSLGSLFSPNDPIIRASGDVALDSYVGASLHIFAGGSVTIPNFIQIQSADAVEGIVEEITLSDGETVVNIDGSTKPTLDIRAGTTAVGIPNIDTAEATSADINLGTILFADADGNPISGTVVLTNQYQPNTELNGDIQISATLENLASQTSGFDSGGRVAIDSKGEISVNGLIRVFAFPIFDNDGNLSFLGNGGEVDFIARENINFESGSVVLSTGLLGGKITLKSDANISANNTTIGSNSYITTSGSEGGDINITAESLFLNDGALIANSTFGQADGGNINVEVSDQIIFDGRNGTLNSGIQSNVVSGANANSGDINIKANTLTLSNNGELLTIVRGIDGISSLPAQGNAGNINLDVEETITLDSLSSIDSRLDVGATGTSGNIELKAKSLSVDDSQIISSTFGVGNAGKISIDIDEDININGSGGNIQNNVEAGAVGDGGEISINANSLTLTNGGQIQTIVREPAQIQIVIDGPILDLPAGQGNGGNIVIKTQGDVNLSGFEQRGEIVFESGIFSVLDSETIGKGGDIQITASSLFLDDSVDLNATTFGEGDAGNIFVKVSDSVVLANFSQINSSVSSGAIGKGGDIDIDSRSLTISGGSQVTSSLLRQENNIFGGSGLGGNIRINASDFVNISGVISTQGFSSGIFASSEVGTSGSAGTITVNTGTLQIADGAVINAFTANASNGGNITINANTLEARNGGQVITTTRDDGNAGNIALNISDTITLSGNEPNFAARLAKFGADIVNNQGAASGIFANGNIDATGNGGQIEIQTSNLTLSDTAQISSENLGEGNAGSIIIGSGNEFLLQEISLTDSNITTAANRASGGAINLSAENIILQGNSNITTNVNNGAGGGGNITLTADSIIAFDDSDIFAFAADGRGGNITLETPAFFGENFTLNSLTSNPNNLEGNSRTDINATGAVSGFVDIPDVSFIQNSLAELPDNAIDTDQLVANSCVVRSQEQNGTFIITGGGGFPIRPGKAGISDFSTGEVRNIPDTESQWQPGDPIVEPQGLYRLNNGKLVLSRECS